MTSYDLLLVLWGIAWILGGVVFVFIMYRAIDGEEKRAEASTEALPTGALPESATASASERLVPVGR